MGSLPVCWSLLVIFMVFFCVSQSCAITPPATETVINKNPGGTSTVILPDRGVISPVKNPLPYNRDFDATKLGTVRQPGLDTTAKPRTSSSLPNQSSSIIYGVNGEVKWISFEEAKKDKPGKYPPVPPASTGEPIKYISSKSASTQIFASLASGSIQLYPKWNAISFPKVLASGYNTATNVFGNLPVTPGYSIWRCYNNGWATVTANEIIKPTECYLINMASSYTLNPTYTESTPSTKTLTLNSNGYGIWGLTTRPLMSEVSQFGTKASSFYYYNVQSQSYVVINNPNALLQPGTGYIINMNTVATYVPMLYPYQASAHGMSTTGINTISEVQYASSKITGLGYGSTVLTSGSASVAHQRIKGDKVFYYSGHGEPGKLVFKKPTANTDILYGNAGSTGYYAISSYSTSDLNDCALVVLNSCNSGMTDPQNSENNLLTKCTQRGVDTAVGFSGTLSTSLSKQWSDAFWNSLSLGDSVSTAIITAKNAVGNTGGYQSAVVVGNSGLTIKPSVSGVL